MALFVTAPNLRTLFPAQEGYAGLADFDGLIVVPSSWHVNLIKGWILAEQGGRLGLELLTPDELKSHSRKVMKFEGAWVLAGVSGSSDWEHCQALYEDARRWGEAGYPLEEIPLPPQDREVLLTWRALLRKKHLEPAWEGPFLPRDKPVAVVGFDSVAAWNLLHQNFQGKLPTDLCLGLIEPEGMTREQMAAIGSLEVLLGEPIRLETPLLQACETLAIHSSAAFVPALQAGLASHKIDKIVYSGASAAAAVVLSAQKLGLPPLAEPAWEGREHLERFLSAQKTSGWMERWELWRAQKAWVGEDCRQEQTRIEQSWQDQGSPEKVYSDFKSFPLQMTLKQFKATAPEAFWKSSEQKFKKLEKILPEQTLFHKNIWLALLTPSVEPVQRFYGGVVCLPLAEAWGLLDEGTILLLGEAELEGNNSLLDKEEVLRRNKSALEGAEGNQKLTRRWIRLSEAILEVQTKNSQAFAGVVIGLAGGFPKGTPIVNYLSPAVELAPEISRHYELPVPVQASCKQWETILQTPEVAWFELLRLKSVWRPSAKDQEGLWVGNWAHGAMSASGGAREFFGNLLTKNAPPLPWRMALARAWALAKHFEEEFAAVQVEASEKEVAGKVNGVPTHGRMDSLVDCGGKKIVVDFKTSAQTKKIPAAQSKTDTLDLDGDGFQIWLYGRLLQAQGVGNLAICRLGESTALTHTREVEGPPLHSEERMKQVYATGILGDGKKTFHLHGGARGRLPYATRAQEEDEDEE